MLQSILNYIKGLINIFYDVRLTPPWYMHTHLKYKSVAGIGGNSQQRRTARRALVSRTVKNIS